jgi:fumarate reductase subunit C
LWLLWSLTRGPESYAVFLAWLGTPLFLVLSTIALLFVLYHAITWFNLAPKAMPVRIGGKRQPDWLVAAPNYVLWVFVSAGIFWLLTRGS